MDKWKSELTEKVSNWEKIVKDPSSWDELEHHKPSKSQYNFNLILDVVGVELAKKWFYSKEGSSRYKAKNWLKRHIADWPKFDDNVKEFLIKEKLENFLTHLNSKKLEKFKRQFKKYTLS